MKDFEKFEHFRMMHEDEGHPITLQGSLLLQACLNFNKPIKVFDKKITFLLANLLFFSLSKAFCPGILLLWFKYSVIQRAATCVMHL